MSYKYNDTPIKLIKMFGCWFSEGKKVNYGRMIGESMKRGYLVHPDISVKDVLDFIQSETFNPNSTFYKEFQDITSKNRWELFVDQIFHYASTYGQDFQGDAWVPNGEPLVLDYKAYKMITATTKEDMYNQCVRVLQTGVAIADDTRKALVDFIITCVRGEKYALDLMSIKNRDAQLELSIELKIVPNDPQAMIRYLFYMVFQSATPIMSENNLAILYQKKQYGDVPCLSKVFTTEHEPILAQVFLRYKDFLLGFKTKENSKFLNRVRKLAKKCHKPMTPGFWENFTNWPIDYINAHIDEEVKKLDNTFKIIRLLEMIKMRKVQNESGSCRLYRIRNGKVWVDRHDIPAYDKGWSTASIKLVHRLVELLIDIRVKQEQSVGRVRTMIRFPEYLELACPKSERQFVGNIPDGSYFDMSGKNNYFGIYWKDEWGTYDFDLHFLADSGARIGWNSDYVGGSKQDVIYSGDMTRANPEAAEMFLIRKDCPNGSISVNRYNGAAGSKFRLFFGQDECKGFHKGYMVDPNTIQLSEMLTSNDAQMIVARIVDKKAYFTSMSMGDDRVARYNEEVNRSISDRLVSAIPLKRVLLGAGYMEWEPGLVDSQGCAIQPDIDLTNLNKDTLLKLFS